MINPKVRKFFHRIYGGLFLALFLLGPLPAASYGKDVWIVELQGAIGPASSDFITSTLADADDAGIELVVIRINTPGGLDLAMRDIILSILSSPVPVATWVAPNGSRAASAGTYILYASHIAAMAPATNVGSSTPVSLGGGQSPLPTPTLPQGDEAESDTSEAAGGSAMEKKVINDAVAYIKSLAELRGRNSEWAVKTVTEAANLTASEALDLNVIDFIAESTTDLLRQVHGKTLVFNDREVTLNVNDATVVIVEPDWRQEFLALITDPNVAYILLMIGFYGIILEFYNPGLGLPGIVGVICLLIGAYALQMLPINYAGLTLILVGIGLMAAEALSPSFGVLGVGGVIAFVLGSVILMDTDLPAYQISLPIIGAFATASAGIFLFALSAVLRMHKHKAVSGVDAMIGTTAVALEDIDPYGQVRASSEIWNASASGAIKKGSTVQITGVDGLTLHIKNQE
jgi:membrane-bound serine protease (ClpP class)